MYCRPISGALLGSVVLVLSACTTVPAPAGAAREIAVCERVFARVDAVVDEARVRDVEAARVAGFSYLRVTRFEASWRDETAMPDGVFADALAALDGRARGVELANLPAAVRRVLRDELAAEGMADPIDATLDRCRERLLARDRGDSTRRALLRVNAHVADNYSAAMRSFGVYPLSSLAFARGIRGWQRDTQAVFATPLDLLPRHGVLTQFIPLRDEPIAAAELSALLVQAGSNRHWPEGVLERIAYAFAPVLTIDVVSNDDRPGHPQHGSVPIDVREPVVFYRAAYARIGNTLHTQLVYTAWFPRRPKTGPLDILGGEIDALIWRVTLDTDGTPLVFDTIHACGCYHMFFPDPRLRSKPAPDNHEEFVFVPQTMPVLSQGERVAVHIAAGTHYVERVVAASAVPHAGVPYRLVAEERLRSLPLDDLSGERRSWYGPDGLVAGSQRLERVLFWPMGIQSAGAMRQWGHHATAFVGRRHFDDPWLIDHRFERLDSLR